MATERDAEDAETFFLFTNREIPIRKKQLIKNLTLFSCLFIISADYVDLSASGGLTQIIFKWGTLVPKRFTILV